MPQDTIRIDGTDFPLSAGRAFVFAGVHSEKDLSGVDMDITAYSDMEIHQIDEMLKKDTVLVEDPFTSRQYEATWGRKSYSYQEGRQERRYQFEVKELDEVVQFSSLEIEGHTFSVIRNTETLDKDEAVSYTHLTLPTKRIV